MTNRTNQFKKLFEQRERQKYKVLLVIILTNNVKEDTN